MSSRGMRGAMDAGEAYGVLGLAPGSGVDDIKAAYRQKALQCHPDTRGGHGSEDFIRITWAYQSLLRARATSHLPTSCAAEAASAGGGRRYAPRRVVYTSGFSGSRSSRTATMVWGVGLGLGGMLFAGILLLGRTMAPRGTVYQGPTRVVEPSHDAAKRERIASLLFEKSSSHAGGGRPRPGAAA